MVSGERSAPADGAGVAVLGAGAWGTGLALHLCRGGYPVTLWGHDGAEVEALARDRENRHYLPGHHLPESLHLTNDLAEAVTAHAHVLVVVPSHAFAEVLGRLSSLLTPQHRLAWATKGLDGSRLRLLHEVAEEQLPDRKGAVISGPSFAREVAAGLPTAVTVASADPDLAEDFARLLHHGHFRAYVSDDIVGVQLGGATKNVLAIAAGIADGLGFGSNARAALITRGLAEMVRLGLARGGRQETFMGLAGMGDLVLTCTDDQSRNRRMGLALGRGQQRDDAARAIGQVVEGVSAAQVVHRMSEQLGVETPIAEQTYQVLHQGLDPRLAVENLLARDLKQEFY